MALRLDKQSVRRMGELVALALTVADLSGRTQVAAEALAETGKSLLVAVTPSFAEGEILAPAKLEPTEALAFFRQKISMTRPAFDRLQRRYREIAFTVAEVESVTLIEKIQTTLADVVREGETRETFVRRVNELTKAAGVSPLNPFHIETVFETNLASALQLGRASQLLQPDVKRALPFWEYRTVGDSRVRPAHRKLNGFIAPADDAAWKRISPPNGFRCRCTVVGRTPSQAEAKAKRRGQNLSVQGLKRLPAQPDKGFEQSPATAFAARLEEARAL